MKQNHFNWLISRSPGATFDDNSLLLWQAQDSTCNLCRDNCYFNKRKTDLFNTEMDWTALLKTIGLCLVSILIEAISATKEGKAWFDKLKRPKYSFPLRIWYFVGAAYYIIFGIIAYRLFSNNLNFFSTPIIFVALIMMLNGLSNFIIFKYRSIKWFYLVIYPFGLLLLALVIVLMRFDKLSALLASTYLCWLIYDLYYGYNLWKLNPIP